VQRALRWNTDAWPWQRYRPAIMAAVRAPVGVVSVGEDNDYGHPAPRHLDVLRRNGYAVHRTDRQGDVAVVERPGAAVAVVTSR